MAPDVAEKFVRDLLKAGDQRRKDAEKVVAEVSAVARRSAEQFSVAVQKEVAKQLGRLMVRIDQLEKQVESLNKNLDATRSMLLAAASKGLGANAKKPAAKKAAAKKPAAKKPAVKKSAAKKSAAKKAAANTTPAS
jgi:polyhydroxyalkanoate synthesis regulator phasin